MKRASSRPQQLKEQLLQAIDAQNNIQNMMAVLDVICWLESHPITKEALVETRLGKLINDVRKRCTDEDLVKRLKILIRRWQRLVEVEEVTAKELSSFPDNSAECIPGSTQSHTENYNRTLLHSTITERPETSQCSVPGKTIKYPNHFRKSKIPVRAIKPYSSSIKHLQPLTSWRTSLSNHHSQNDNSITHQHKFERNTPSANHSDEKQVLSARGPEKSTSVTSNRPNTYKKQPPDLLNIFKPTTHNLDEVFSTVSNTNIICYEDKKQHNSQTVKLDGDNSYKTAKLQAGKLANDPYTQQIKPTSIKTFTKDCLRSTGSEIHSLHSFRQTNWREVSQRKMIQNSLLTSEKSGMSLSVDDVKKSKECRKKTHGFTRPELPVTELPGVSREVTEQDLIRIRSERWHGVNGCYDNWNNWYDWTQSITLDPYGDGSKFQILPYVGIDYRL